MSTQTEITRLQTARNKLRTWLVGLGLAVSTDKLDTLATAAAAIKNQGAVDASVKEGESYTIPAGYHNGTGTVKGVSGGGNYQLQAKTVTPTKEQQAVTPDQGYYGLSGVTVGAIPEAYQDVSATTAAPGDVLANKVFVDAEGVTKTGTMLTATVKPADASNKTVTWASSAPTVASVVNGVVTALAPGSAKITVKTADGGFTAEYALTVKAATFDLLASYGYADNTRLSTGSGSEKPATGYVTIGHTAAIPIDKTRYPNGATIRVTGAVNCLGNNWSGTDNGGDSAFVLYTTGGTQFSNASYIEAKTTTAGTFTIDADKTGFTLDIASLSAPHYLKFCVKGVGANLTATLTPK